MRIKKRHNSDFQESLCLNTLGNQGLDNIIESFKCWSYLTQPHFCLEAVSPVNTSFPGKQGQFVSPRSSPGMLEGADAGTKQTFHPDMKKIPLRRERSVWTQVNGRFSQTRDIWDVELGVGCNLDGEVVKAEVWRGVWVWLRASRVILWLSLTLFICGMGTAPVPTSHGWCED